MLIDKDALTKSLHQKRRYTLSYLYPATLDVFRSATLPVTGLSLLELMGLTVNIPIAGLAISASLFAISTLLTSVVKTGITHQCENKKIAEILALNDHPRLLRLVEKLKIIHDSETAKIVLMMDDEFELSDYLKNNNLSKILDDFFDYYEYIENNKDQFKTEYFKLQRKVEFLASNLKSEVGKEYANYLLPKHKLKSTPSSADLYKKPWYIHAKNIGVDTVKGAIFGASLAAFIIKLILPTLIMTTMPYVLAIYLPAIAVGIITYIILDCLKRRAETHAKICLKEVERETEDKIVALDLFVHAQELYENAPNPQSDSINDELVHKNRFPLSRE